MVTENLASLIYAENHKSQQKKQVFCHSEEGLWGFLPKHELPQQPFSWCGVVRTSQGAHTIQRKTDGQILISMVDVESHSIESWTNLHNVCLVILILLSAILHWKPICKVILA